MKKQSLSKNINRTGAALVEMAVVLPFFVMILLAIVEFGRAMTVSQLITTAARDGGRVAIMDGTTNTEVIQIVRDSLAPSLSVDPSDINVTISTKIGLRFDENRRQVLGEDIDPADLTAALNSSRTRLKRDHLDIVLLRLNTVPVAKAGPIFDVLGDEIAKGRVGAYGWSCDFPDAVNAVAERPGFLLVQHAMNVFFDAPSMMDVVERRELASFNRSPLAMGLLTGKFNDGEAIRPGDVRLNNLHWMDYFKDGKVTPDFIARVEAVRDLLTVGGRSLAQGALGWLWAKSPATFPIPGARTPGQAIHNAKALAFGALPEPVMDEIELVLQRPPEGPARER